ncbi:VPLPA-CTERM sorting domain-containing protein [Roseobacter litoralis]|uniref:VPLPA-CTERM sorting domain-containing protein n=1 Tax=Roseobacter litoralis TaxID=42443 RepID=UPI0024957234|nr:VPLPA-CTERM sorting domain-containing protein [Roseobacter litoralis]
MKFTKTLLAATFALGTTLTGASAATLNNGGSVCEGPGSLLAPGVGAACDATFGDGGQADGPTVDINFSGTGAGVVFGGIRGLDNNRYLDVFDLQGSGEYRLTLSSIRITDSSRNVISPEAPFDATWILGGLTIGTISNLVVPGVYSLTTVVDLSTLTTFSLDASGGGATDGNVMEYRLDIAAVPLPASALLLLAGVGGLGAMRRFGRKS